MLKNVATKVAVTAYDYTTGAFKTGDAANLTLYVSKDGATPVALADTSATELDATNNKGRYVFDVAASETNGDDLDFTGKSVTANIQIVPRSFATTDLSLFAVVARGTAQSGSATTIQLAAATNLNADNNPQGFTCYIVSGTGAGQARAFASYVNSTDTGTVGTWTTTPDNTSVYIIYATAPIDSSITALTAAIAAVQAAVDNLKTRTPAALISGRMDANVGSVNGVVVGGTGATLTPWGPA